MVLGEFELRALPAFGSHRHPAVEAGAIADVAAGAAGDLDPQPDAILVVIDPHLDHFLHESAGGALVPELLTAAAPVVGLAGLDRLGEGLAVHHGHHQHLAGGMVGGHTGDEALRVELRCQLMAFLNLLHGNSLAER